MMLCIEKHSISLSSTAKSKNKDAFLLCQSLKKIHNYCCKLPKLLNH